MNGAVDIAVIGGGPCGLFSAMTAAKSGTRVVVFEEHEEVGLPSHCAGHISIAGLNRLGLKPPASTVENRISGSVFHSPSGYEFRVRLASPITYAVNRSAFDKHLAQLAVKTGAQLRVESRVKSLLFSNGFVQGVSLKSGGKVASKIVIDAEGCASAFVKQTGLPTFNKSLAVSAVNCQVDQANDVERDMVEVYLGQHYAPGLFAWIIPKQDGSANVGLATKAGNPRACLDRFLKRHPVASKKLKGSNARSHSYHLIPLGGPIPRTYHNGLLIVGDAASHVKPTTGGGVVMGLTCAKIAGEVARESVARDDSSEIFLRRYQEKWRKILDFDMSAMLQTRLMLNRLSDSKIDRIIRLCSRLQLGNNLIKAKDIDYQGKTLLSLFKHPSALAIAFYIFLQSLTSLHASD